MSYVSRRHCVIADTQVKPGVPLNHLLWIGDYIAEKQPDVIVHIGDHHDMPSLSVYDKGTKRAEGKTYADDVAAGNFGIALLMRHLLEVQARQRSNKQKIYSPRKVITLGNHEERIARHVNANPNLIGALGFHDLAWEQYGWEVIPFLTPIKIDGIAYCHYFINPRTGKPLGGALFSRLRQVGFSFTMGHQQGKDQAERYLADGTVHRGLVVGSYYLHNEDYLGPQGNHHWRGAVMKHEVRDGNYDLLELSIEYLRQRYEKKYPTADHSPIFWEPGK